MASKGNKIESWEANPWTHPPNANVIHPKFAHKIQLVDFKIVLHELQR